MKNEKLSPLVNTYIGRAKAQKLLDRGYTPQQLEKIICSKHFDLDKKAIIIENLLRGKRKDGGLVQECSEMSSKPKQKEKKQKISKIPRDVLYPEEKRNRVYPWEYNINQKGFEPPYGTISRYDYSEYMPVWR